MRKPVAFAIAASVLAGSGLGLLGPSGASATDGTDPVVLSGTAHPAVTASSLRWGRCGDADLRAVGAVCANLQVPLDYAKPAGKQISIALSMVRHTVPASQYQGVMLVNPGGPGGGGKYLSFLGQLVPGDAGDAYDWIGWDPRGVGDSRPALRCDGDIFKGPRPQYNPTTKKLESYWLKKMKSYAVKCGKDGGSLLDHVTTVDSVGDMESIRKAMGQSQINFYGFSYGTYLGSVYATLHPDQTRRLVFDSNVDPRTVWYQANYDQDVAFEKTMAAWWSWLATHHKHYRLGKSEKTVKARFYKYGHALAKHPAGGVVGPSEWRDIFTGAGYYQSTWTELGAVFSQWVHGRHKAPLVAEYQDEAGVGDDNEYAMYDATSCTDAPMTRSWSTWKKDSRRVAKEARFLTWANTWFAGPCIYWPAKAHQPVTVDGSQVPSLLLIDETLDAATPYEGSLYLRSLFPNASLIALPGGTSHANSLDGDACLDDQIAAYLADGTLPARVAGNQADTTCQPLPLPSLSLPHVLVAGPLAAKQQADSTQDSSQLVRQQAITRLSQRWQEQRVRLANHL